jgi:prepilin-type N-terminal cleavage/methylation domain-containing protein
MRILSPHRRGFTLLEVLLASIIAVIMMAALYVSIETQLREMDEGRSAVETSSLARALLNRITLDLTPSLAPPSPKLGTTSGSTSGSTSGTGSSENPEGVIDEAAPVVFSVGVTGDSTRVSIFLTKLNRQVIIPPEDGTGINSPSSDVRRIKYFRVADGGLARQEIRLVTSDAVDLEPESLDEFTTVIAEEVTDFELQYFDGTSWQSSWDGSEVGGDGKTPKGPPRAIEVRISLRDSFGRERPFRHVIALPTAPGDVTTNNTTTGP